MDTSLECKNYAPSRKFGAKKNESKSKDENLFESAKKVEYEFKEK